jgi:hypothetical protein
MIRAKALGGARTEAFKCHVLGLPEPLSSTVHSYGAMFLKPSACRLVTADRLRKFLRAMRDLLCWSGRVTPASGKVVDNLVDIEFLDTD